MLNDSYFSIALDSDYKSEYAVLYRWKVLTVTKNPNNERNLGNEVVISLMKYCNASAWSYKISDILNNELRLRLNMDWWISYAGANVLIYIFFDKKIERDEPITNFCRNTRLIYRILYLYKYLCISLPWTSTSQSSLWA